MTLPQEWIKTTIIIMVATKPIKKTIIMKKTLQPMKMVPDPTQPMKMEPYIPKILQKMINRVRWVITLQTRHQE